MFSLAIRQLSNCETLFCHGNWTVVKYFLRVRFAPMKATITRRPGASAMKQRKPRRAGRPDARGGAVLSADAIIEAALEAFALTGYEAMSVRELTRKLGVSHNLVHHYFRSKAELWRAC